MAAAFQDALEIKANRLAQETSPYLRQHAHNPVDWHPWGEEALAKAKSEDRPVFLSIGYAACHWCHVMERESFEDPVIASFLNKFFVSIKVDREERPDLDEIYMSAVVAMNGSGGWPMSVFLTPDLEPFFGGAYFPPADAYGRPGFLTILRGVLDAWRHRRQEVLHAARGMTEHLRRLKSPAEEAAPYSSECVQEAVEQLIHAYDHANGGWDSAPKFPSSGAIGLLLREYQRTGDRNLLRMATHTLDRMAGGGLYDHLGGGFHRYAVDAAWRVPHFEKMLYDNAQLAQVYVEAYQATGHARYRRVAEETFGYLLCDMRAPEGAFYSSEDADSEGEEGRFYLWTEPEIVQVLGPEEGAWFCANYDVEDSGNFDSHEPYHAGQNILHAQMNDSGAESPESERRLTALRAKLFMYRGQRPRPARDDKILTSWNALAISALAHGAQVFGEIRYREAACRAAAFILKEMTRDGQLLHTHCQGESRIPGFLDDYAFLSNALIDLYEATFDMRWLRASERLAQQMIDLFWDGDHGPFYLTSEQHTDVLIRPKPVFDGVEPSGNSMAALALFRLTYLCENTAYEARARHVLESCAPAMARVPLAHLKMLQVAQFALTAPYEIVLSGRPGDAALTAFTTALHSVYLPNKVVAFANAEAHTDEMPPMAAEKPMLDSQTTAYICRDHTCAAPTARVEEFLKALKDGSGHGGC